MVAMQDGEIRARGSPEEVVTAELLAEVFRVDGEVGHTERGPRVTPLRARDDDRETPEDAEDASPSPEAK